MPASVATSGFGCLFKVGDSGVGAGSRAFVEWGTTNQKIRIRWNAAGTAGNGKNVTVAVSGSVFATTEISASAVNITAPTTATVAQVVAYLYANETFQLYWDADYGATPGDGSGVITARTVTATAGGTAGTEVFTTVAEVKSISGPNMQTQMIDVTHMQSDNNTREFLPSLIDPGEISFSVNWLPGNATHVSLKNDQKNRTKRNYQLVFTDTAATTYAFSGYITSIGITSAIEDVLQGDITVKLVSWPE